MEMGMKGKKSLGAARARLGSWAMDASPRELSFSGDNAPGTLAVRQMPTESRQVGKGRSQTRIKAYIYMQCMQMEDVTCIHSVLTLKCTHAMLHTCDARTS